MQPHPQYTQPNQQYIQSNPQYMQSIPQYIQPNPQYMQSNPQYVQPNNPTVAIQVNMPNSQPTSIQPILTNNPPESKNTRIAADMAQYGCSWGYLAWNTKPFKDFATAVAIVLIVGLIIFFGLIFTGVIH